MRDGEFVTMMQQQEEDKAQKLMEKEQWAMSSTPTGKALLVIQCVLSLHHYLLSSIPQNLGFASKVTTLATDSMFFFADRLLHLQAVFIVAGKIPLWTQGSITQTCHHLGMICTNIVMNPTESITNRVTANFSGLPTYDIWSLGCIIFRCLFGPPLCNFDCQQINSLQLFLYTIDSISLK